MISDKVHEERLKKKDAVIVTEFHDGGAVKSRSTDRRKNDDIKAGVILAKRYYLHGKLRHQETEFNPGILYSYVFPSFEDGKVQCPACGGTGPDALFSEGCPYCGAFYNMNYSDETPGAREHSDYVVNRRSFFFLVYILIVAFSIAAGVLIAVTAGRTATVFDYLKGGLIGLAAGSAVSLFLAWSRQKKKNTLTSGEIRKKAEQDRVLEKFREDLQENGLSTGIFASSLNLGLRDYYFGSDSEEARDIIDFDVLDYRNRQLTRQGDAVTVTAEIDLRLVSAEKDRITSRETTKTVRLKKSNSAGTGLKGGLNITACPYCGASIDLTARRCSYCGTSFKFERPLNIEKVSD